MGRRGPDHGGAGLAGHEDEPGAPRARCVAGRGRDHHGAAAAVCSRELALAAALARTRSRPCGAAGGPGGSLGAPRRSGRRAAGSAAGRGDGVAPEAGLASVLRAPARTPGGWRCARDWLAGEAERACVHASAPWPAACAAATGRWRRRARRRPRRRPARPRHRSCRPPAARCTSTRSNRPASRDQATIACVRPAGRLSGPSRSRAAKSWPRQSGTALANCAAPAGRRPRSGALGDVRGVVLTPVPRPACRGRGRSPPVGAPEDHRAAGDSVMLTARRRRAG